MRSLALGEEQDRTLNSAVIFRMILIDSASSESSWEIW